MRRPFVAAAAADQNAAFRRVFDRVGDEVLQQPAQQAAVGLHRQRRGNEDQIEALFARQRRIFELELAQHFVDPEGDDFRLHRAGIEPRNIEQRTEDFLHRVERRVDIGDELRVVAAPCRSTSEVT